MIAQHGRDKLSKDRDRRSMAPSIGGNAANKRYISPLENWCYVPERVTVCAGSKSGSINAQMLQKAIPGFNKGHG